MSGWPAWWADVQREAAQERTEPTRTERNWRSLNWGGCAIPLYGALLLWLGMLSQWGHPWAGTIALVGVLAPVALYWVWIAWGILTDTNEGPE